MNKLIPLVAFSALLLIPTLAFGGGAGIIIVTDEDFDDSDWASTKILDTTVGASATFTAGQITSGGNPDNYRETKHTYDFGSISVAHLNSFSHDPSTQGAIDSIDCSFDARHFNGPPGQAVAVSITLFQSGTYYSAPGFLAFLDSWEPASFTDISFTNVVGPGPPTPDLSSTGVTFQLGYITSNTNSGGTPDLMRLVGIDNFQCALNLVEQPNGEPPVVGGELLPIDSTALMLAGLQTSAIWMLPVLAGVAGSAFGILYIKSRRN